MVNDRESNLVNIDGQIERFKSSLVRRIKAFFRLNPNLDEIDKAELEEIRSRIELVEINQSAIFIAQQPACDDKKLIQEDLLARDKAVQLAKLKYTHQQIQQLRNDMTNPKGIYYRVAQKHPQLFRKITPTLEKMIQALETGRKDEKDEKDDRLQLSAAEEIFFQAESPLYCIASMTSGRYHIFNQALDPLALTNSDGSCYGYVVSWAKQVATGKPGADFLRPNREVRDIQIHQVSYAKKAEKKQAVFLTQHGTYLHTADKLLEQVGIGAVYGINLFSAAATTTTTTTIVGHRIGLRKIASTGEIECYDPNYGVFAFKDESAFTTWFIALLSHYNSEGSITVQLNQIGTQAPSTSCSFVPSAVSQEVKNPRLSLPIIELTDSNNTCKNKLNTFYENIQLAGIEMLQGIITKENDYTIQEHLNRQQASYKTYLKEFLFFKEELKITNKPESDQDDILKTKAYEAIDNQIAASSSENLKEFLHTLKKQIKESPQTVSLEILINHVLSQKQSGKSTTWAEILSASDKDFLVNLSKNFEISPFILTILQEKLLLKIAAVAASFPNSKKHQEVTQVIKKYLTGDLPLTETFSHLQRMTSKVQIDFFAKLMSTEGIAAEGFYQLLRKIDPTNPSSFAQAQSRMSCFLRKSNPPESSPKPEPAAHR